MDSYYGDYSMEGYYDGSGGDSGLTGYYDPYEYTDTIALEDSPASTPVFDKYIRCTWSCVSVHLHDLLYELSEMVGIHVDECLYAFIMYNWNHDKTMLQLLEDYVSVSEQIHTHTWYKGDLLYNILQSSTDAKEYYSKLTELSQDMTGVGKKTMLEGYAQYLHLFTQDVITNTNNTNTNTNATTSTIIDKCTDTCMVCYDSQVLLTTCCGHSYCVECWYQHIQVNINTNMGYAPNCMMPECNSKLPNMFIRKIDELYHYIHPYKGSVTITGTTTTTTTDDGTTSSSNDVDKCIYHLAVSQYLRLFTSGSKYIRDCGNASCNTVFVKNDGNHERIQKLMQVNAELQLQSYTQAPVIEFCANHPTHSTILQAQAQAQTPSNTTTTNNTFTFHSPQVTTTTNTTSQSKPLSTPALAVSTSLPSTMTTGQDTLGGPLSSSLGLSSSNFDFTQTLATPRMMQKYPPMYLASMSSTVKCDCGTIVCLGCGERNDHRPSTCDDIRLWNAQSSTHKESTEWLLYHTRRCSKCNIRIEKNAGCNHITCSNCKYEFCWTCGEDWVSHITRSKDALQAYRCINYSSKHEVPVDIGSSTNTSTTNTNSNTTCMDSNSNNTKTLTNDDVYIKCLHYINRTMWDINSLELMKDTLQQKASAYERDRLLKQTVHSSTNSTHNRHIHPGSLSSTMTNTNTNTSTTTTGTSANTTTANQNLLLSTVTMTFQLNTQIEEGRLCCIWARRTLLYSYIHEYASHVNHTPCSPLYLFARNELTQAVDTLQNELVKNIDDYSLIKKYTQIVADACTKFVTAYSVE